MILINNKDLNLINNLSKEQMSNILKAHRVKSNKTQRNVSDILKVNTLTYANKEKNPLKFTLKELLTLMSVYNVNSLDELVFDIRTT